MDWLLHIREALEKRVFDRACEVLGLEVDLLFFDTCGCRKSANWADAPTVRRRLGSVSGALLAGGVPPGRAMIFGLWA
jgi:hypothetical protein